MIFASSSEVYGDYDGLMTEDVMEKNFINFSNLVGFMGKNGKHLVESSIKKWDFDYKKKRSITSKDSFLINIKNVKKK